VIVLDTHAWLWLVSDPKRLGRAAVEAIDQADELGVSAISCWEIAMLAAKGRIALDRPTLDWLEAALAGSSVTLPPVDPGVATLAATLPLHGDSADRLIVATALIRPVPLVTKDEAIQESGLLQTVW
jgi:PIN domain nuclease of toxin-antitoxin system